MKLPEFVQRIARALGIPLGDARSLRYVAVIECLLNQNARDLGAATFPACNRAVLQLCMQHDIGILQIPCPEIKFMGFRRTRPPGIAIRQALASDAGRRCCQEISREVGERVQEYLENGCKLLAVLGGNPESPGCAAECESEMHGTTCQDLSSGVLMQALQDELHSRGISVPFKGIRDYRAPLLRQDLKWLEELFSLENPATAKLAG